MDLVQEVTFSEIITGTYEAAFYSIRPLVHRVHDYPDQQHGILQPCNPRLFLI